ncbi:hypothetical protein D6B98_35885 [Bradyrhizobium sp. LVM 105]|nr:hypothetical protein D6B98_35885 [Bradyrhizobium sp. LVM 105]
MDGSRPCRSLNSSKIRQLAEQGEAIVQSRNFFAVFESAEEWRLTVSGRTLGTLPISFPVHKDIHAIRTFEPGRNRPLFSKELALPH